MPLFRCLASLPPPSPSLSLSTQCTILTESDYDIRQGDNDRPITAYNPPAIEPLEEWMAPSDARSRIALHMNWNARTLSALLKGLPLPGTTVSDPSLEEIRAASPLAQIRSGNYKTPTFLLHGGKDDLIPWQQTRRTYEALQERDVPSEFRVLPQVVHLFDTCRGYEKDEAANLAVREAYGFLYKKVNGRI